MDALMAWFWRQSLWLALAELADKGGMGTALVLSETTQSMNHAANAPASTLSRISPGP